jgi:hypothetical protein
MINQQVTSLPNRPDQAAALAVSAPDLVPSRTPPFSFTPTAGRTRSTRVAQLVNYWVGVSHVRRGQLISFDYVIQNPTNDVAELLLGASIKPKDGKSWALAISDPPHDVVANVLPGTTTHLRYFRVPGTLQPGIYDVAWGLRDTTTGRRVALVVARNTLRVTP